MDDLDRFYSSPRERTGADAPHTAASDDRRQAIIVAAYQLIVEKGFAEFRIRDAAQRAGITGATLYYYFPTKEALIQAVDSYLTQLIMAHQARWSTEESASPREQLHAHLSGVQQLLQHDPTIFVALSELGVRSLRDPAVQQVIDAGEAGWQGYLASVIAAGVQQGQFRADLDPRVAAWTILSFIKGINLRARPEATLAGMALLEHLLST